MKPIKLSSLLKEEPLQPTNASEQDNTYMFFQNLKTIKHAVSHLLEMDQAAISKLLKDGGMYIIEDLHTSLAENGLHLYGKDLEIAEDKANTTLHYLTNKPLNSVYLTDEQNEELRQQFDQYYVFSRDNELMPAAFGGKSITSVLLKNNKQ